MISLANNDRRFIIINAWIRAIDTSSKDKIIIDIKILMGLRINILLRRNIRRWPEIMLAEIRMVRVIGRIKILVISIKTMGGIRKFGVPGGVNLIKKFFGNIFIDIAIIDIHINTAILVLKEIIEVQIKV